MAFGTGHHATTRLCLAALQLLNLAGTVVLDVGTGSGILAIAARKLGAAAATGIDNDPDAVDCARANLQLNATVDNVSFELVDFTDYAARSPAVGRPDVVTANLTGTLLCRIAPALAQAFAPGGALIVSGALAEEQHAVAAAFRDLDVVWEQTEDEWVAMGFARFER
jgi:ribosomal protein L11 methyltransferase